MVKEYIRRATKIILKDIDKHKNDYGGIDIALDSCQFCGILNHNSTIFQTQCEEITEYLKNKYPNYKISFTIDTLPEGCIACSHHISIVWR